MLVFFRDDVKALFEAYLLSDHLLGLSGSIPFDLQALLFEILVPHKVIVTFALELG